MTGLPFNPEIVILVVPLAAAALLAVLPGYRLTARLNVAATLATFLSALSLFFLPRAAPGTYLLVDDLPATDPGRVYQLWGVVDGTVLSLGTFGADTDMVRFHIDPSRIDGVEAFAVTDEAAPGVVASEEEPVVAGTV